MRTPLLLLLLLVAAHACGDDGPSPVVSATARLALGWGHGCRLSRAAEVQCWSWRPQNEHEVGRAEIAVPAPLPSVDLGHGVQVYAVAAGMDHTCALLATGGVKCWGINERGQLGLGDRRDRGADPADMGDALPELDLALGPVIALSCGFRHCCALSDDRRVKCWGANDDGQLGLGDREDRGDDPGEMGAALPVVDLGSNEVVVDISCGGVHTCALLESGRAKCWGLSEWGRLGYLDAEADSPGDEPDEMGDALPHVEPGSTTPIVEISAGHRHTCVRSGTGELKCWGKNSDDICDDYPDYYPCGLIYENVGRLGRGDPFDRWNGDGRAVDLGADVRAEHVHAGYLHTCALTDEGRVKCWGANDYGQLGLGDADDRGGEREHLGDALPHVDFGAGLEAVELRAGLYHTCVLLADDRVKCWGQDFGGARPEELGDALPFVAL